MSVPEDLRGRRSQHPQLRERSLANPLFADDFANSCNTAFVQLAEKLGDGDLAKVPGLGIGAGWEKTVGVNGAFAGSIPENTGATDKAAATIGQGRNLTSPSLSQ